MKQVVSPNTSISMGRHCQGAQVSVEAGEKGKQIPFSAAHGSPGPGQPPERGPSKRRLSPAGFPGSARAMAHPQTSAGGASLNPDSTETHPPGKMQVPGREASWQGGRCSEPGLPSPISPPQSNCQGSIPLSSSPICPHLPESPWVLQGWGDFETCVQSGHGASSPW